MATPLATPQPAITRTYQGLIGIKLDLHTEIPYIPVVDIEFDVDKDAENIRQRGISLAFGAVIIKTAFGQVEDTRRDYGEVRMKAFAECNGLWFCCTYTERGTMTRIVSVHRVSRKGDIQMARKMTRMTVTSDRHQDIVQAVDWDRQHTMTDEEIDRQNGRGPGCRAAHRG